MNIYIWGKTVQLLQIKYKIVKIKNSIIRLNIKSDRAKERINEWKIYINVFTTCDYITAIEIKFEN